jgi:hypothetical protein
MHLLFILIVAGLIVLKLAGLAAISWWLFFGVALIPPLACLIILLFFLVALRGIEAVQKRIR